MKGPPMASRTPPGLNGCAISGLRRRQTVDDERAVRRRTRFDRIICSHCLAWATDADAAIQLGIEIREGVSRASAVLDDDRQLTGGLIQGVLVESEVLEVGAERAGCCECACENAAGRGAPHGELGRCPSVLQRDPEALDDRSKRGAVEEAADKAADRIDDAASRGCENSA
jgi:hypothetical protein